MTLSKKALLSLLIAGALFIGFMVGLILFKNSTPALASTFLGSEYNATTTSSSWTSKECSPSLTSQKVLGSIVVALTSNAPLYIYDATTTNASNRTNAATTTIVALPTTTVGTYTYDVRVKYGLCVVQGESTVGIASTTLTYRP